MATAERGGNAEAVLADVMQHFYIPPELPALLPKFDELKASLPAIYRQAAEAFEFNIASVVSTVSLPLTLADSAAQGSHWQRIHTAERIRTLKRGPEAIPEEQRDEHALKIASAKMKESSTLWTEVQP